MNLKFHYEYRTSDNVRHKGVISAVDREAAFTALKAKGIKPGRVVEAPGLLNKLFGKGKRWFVIAVLAGGLLAVLCILHSAIRTAETAGADLKAVREEARNLVSTFDDTTRRQVIGDVVIISKGIATGWEDVFPYEGERFLASFAIPGVPAGLRNTSEAELLAALNRSADESVKSDSDVLKKYALEVRQIRAIVEGMKQELREYLNGGGTLVGYGKALVQRQEKEIGIYNRAKAEIDRAVEQKMPEADFIRLWEKRNNELRNIGVKLIPIPSD